MKQRAYSKINLALDVFNVREDGYHDIRSIMIPLNFYDELEIYISNVDEYYCNSKSIYFDDKNSIIKMIKVFKEEFNINDHYYINLKKHIPMKAGLGGGTADAAATLKILCNLYNKKLTKKQLVDMCMRVGADVYFNYVNLPSVVSGIGDIVEPFIMKDEYYVLLVKPRKGISTKLAYDNLDMDLCDHPDIDRLKEALENGEDINNLLGNSLEQPSFLLNEDIKKIKDTLISYELENVLMSGSGSTVFAISKDENKLKNVHELVKNKGYFTRLTKTL